MGFCVLVKISKRMVSFWYQSEKNAYAPLMIKESNEVPLFFYVNGNDFIFGKAAKDRFYANDPNAFGNYFEIVKDPGLHFSIYGNKKPVKQLFYYGVEQCLSYFINAVLYKGDSIESYRQQFPLRFMFDVDIEEKEKSLIKTLFAEAGYDNVENVDYNSSLLDVLLENGIVSNSKSALLLKGVDDNLYVELYKKLPGELTGVLKLGGQGADIRVKILSEMIVDYIFAQNPYLAINKGLEVTYILSFTATLLDNIAPIMQGEAELMDGKKYWFRVNTRNLEERLLFASNDNVIYDAIDDLLKSSGLGYENTIILLGSEELNTAYFLNKLHKKYPVVKGIDASYLNDAIKLVFAKIIEAGYQPPKKPPELRTILPVSKKPEADGNNVAGTPGLPPVTPAKQDTIKPVLPPVNKPGSHGGLDSIGRPFLPPAPNNMGQANKPMLPEATDNLRKLIGKKAIVSRPLTPSGKVTIDDKGYDAIAEKAAIEKGCLVKVIGVIDAKFLRVEKIILPPPLPKKINQ